MATQRMGLTAVPSPDALTAVLFAGAAALTILVGTLALVAGLNAWPPTPENFGLAVMVVAWISAYERRRHVHERTRRQMLAGIDELEQYLIDNP